ncbi:MAG: hypothetical protein ACE5K0_10830 [Candidatus Methanofastidiosia archaeon]
MRNLGKVTLYFFILFSTVVLTNSYTAHQIQKQMNEKEATISSLKDIISDKNLLNEALEGENKALSSEIVQQEEQISRLSLTIKTLEKSLKENGNKGIARDNLPYLVLGYLRLREDEIFGEGFFAVAVVTSYEDFKVSDEGEFYRVSLRLPVDTMNTAYMRIEENIFYVELLVNKNTGDIQVVTVKEL